MIADFNLLSSYEIASKPESERADDYADESHAQNGFDASIGGDGYNDVATVGDQWEVFGADMNSVFVETNIDAWLNAGKIIVNAEDGHAGREITGCGDAVLLSSELRSTKDVFGPQGPPPLPLIDEERCLIEPDKVDQLFYSVIPRPALAREVASLQAFLDTEIENLHDDICTLKLLARRKGSP